MQTVEKRARVGRWLDLETTVANEEVTEAALVRAISGLKTAVMVLSKRNAGLKMPPSHIIGVAATVQNVLQKHASLLAGVLTHSERNVLSTFIQAPEDYYEEGVLYPLSGGLFICLARISEALEMQCGT